MKAAAIALAIGALASGLWAARQWYRSSQIQPDPNWPLDPTGTLPFEPVDQTLKQMGHTVAIYQAMQKSAALNASAARWTALSVVLGALAAIVGSLA
jgi:hypothetical protein